MGFAVELCFFVGASEARDVLRYQVVAMSYLSALAVVMRVEYRQHGAQLSH
jgi:hypothetical protein